MLTTSQQLLSEARRSNVAIGAFNTNNLEITQAIIGAAEKNSSPVIVQTSMKAIKYAGLEALSSAIVAYAEKSSVPVVLHLDHGDFDTAMMLVEGGKYMSVMFDGSKLPIEENIEKTKALVEVAHKKDIAVEAEVGAVGKEGGRLDYTDPDTASRFVEQTKCDSLAVAFGNLHGQQTGEEKLNFDVLASISQKVSIPLVFHGASNLSDGDYKKAIELGVAKINIDTEIRQALTTGLKQYLSENPDDIDPRKSLSFARTLVEDVISNKIIIFSGTPS